MPARKSLLVQALIASGIDCEPAMEMAVREDVRRLLDTEVDVTAIAHALAWNQPLPAPPPPSDMYDKIREEAKARQQGKGTSSYRQRLGIAE